MKTRKMAMVWIGVLLLGIVSGANAAEVQKYVWGSGPMGGLWRIGVGAAVQMINEQYKDKYFYTAAASGGGVENVRRMIGGEFDTTWAHTNIMQEASTGTGMFDGQKPYQGHAGDGLHGRPGGLRDRAGQVADQDLQRPGGEEGERRRPGRDRAFDRQEHVQGPRHRGQGEAELPQPRGGRPGAQGRPHRRRRWRPEVPSPRPSSSWRAPRRSGWSSRRRPKRTRSKRACPTWMRR